MGDRSALELAESSEWAALHRMVSAHPVRAEELDDFGMMPLHWACTDTHVPLRAVKVLAEAYPLAAVLRNKGGLVPLHIAVKANAKTEVLRALVAARDEALVEETPAGETPAELAATVGLARDKVAFLAHAEQQLRASGRAPPRASDRYKSLLALQHEQGQQHLGLRDGDQGDENAPPNAGGGSSRSRRASAASSVDSGWVLTGTSANSLSSAGMTSVGQLRAPPLCTAQPAAVALPPRWRLDSRCNICQVKFSYFKNRHHCRSCGESVCSTHSNRRVPLKHAGFATPQRVCILCYDELRETGKPASAVVNMYANALRKDSGHGGGHGGKDALAVRSQSYDPHQLHSQHPQPPRSGALLRPTRSVLALPTGTAAGGGHLHTGASAPPPVYFDDHHDSDNADDRARPRAWTELDAAENFGQMQSHVRELQTHMLELQLSKQRLELQLAVGEREAATARQERLAHEYTVAELRAGRLLDVGRLPLEDDPNVLQVDDDDDNDYDSEDDRDALAEDDVAVDAALTCNYLGMALYEKGEFASAILEFRKSVGLNARDPDVWYNLARALHGAGELDDAEIAVRRALGLTARSYALLALLGKILHSKGEDDKSIDVFREALGLMDQGDESDSDDDVGSATVGW
ncbi:hypothetical protein PybrP1_006416 [[Pythium] brassicae (nom. inval.)]|nr:hypothetical protein PybrP1_006416 [[Pythium] brassicae (nom. inval.)]